MGEMWLENVVRQRIVSSSSCYQKCTQIFCFPITGMTLFVQPFSLFAVVSRDVIYSGAWCYIHGYLFTVFVVTIQLSLLMISLDRNYAIMNSLRYPYICTQSLCNVLIALSWLFGVIMAIPPLAGAGLGKYNFQKHQYICSLDWTTGHAYLGILSSVAFLIPILIQGCCYLKIFMAALGHSKRSRRVHPWVTQSSSKFQDGPSESSESSDSVNSSIGSPKATECKAVRTIFLIAVAYCICWVPYFTDAYLLLKSEESMSSLSATAICMVFTTSVLNPVIYAYMNRVTRREIGRFLCGNPVQPEADDYISTSMSTFSAAKQVAAGWPLPERHRSRSTGGIFSNEMDTILEETEDNCCETRSEGNYPICDTNTHAPAHATHCEPLCSFNPHQRDGMISEQKVQTDAIHPNKFDLVHVRPVEERVSNEQLNEGIKLKVKQKGNSLWNIVKSEKFCEERRKTSRSNSYDAMISKYRKRKSRDCGSFLYFQHNDQLRAKLKSINRTVSRSEMSVDHKISVTELPDRLKFRVSVTDLDKHKKALTLNSKVEIKNTGRTFDREIASTSRDTFKSRVDDMPMRARDKRRQWRRSSSFSVSKQTGRFDCQSTIWDLHRDCGKYVKCKIAKVNCDTRTCMFQYECAKYILWLESVE